MDSSDLLNAGIGVMLAASIFVTQKMADTRRAQHLWLLGVILLLATVPALNTATEVGVDYANRLNAGGPPVDVSPDTVITVWAALLCLILARKSWSTSNDVREMHSRRVWRLHSTALFGGFATSMGLLALGFQQIALLTAATSITAGWASAVFILKLQNWSVTASALAWLASLNAWMLSRSMEYEGASLTPETSAAILCLAQLSLAWHIFALYESCKQATLEGTAKTQRESPPGLGPSEDLISGWPRSIGPGEEQTSRQGEFLATMSHELRTPLSCIVAVSRLLSSNDDFGHRVRKDLGTVERLALQLLRTVDEGLAFIRDEPTDGAAATDQSVLMAHLLRDIKSLAAWLAQQHRNELVFLSVKNIPAQLCFDEQRVRQILINLITNATRYCQDGQITLGVALRDKQGKPHLEWLIEDTGVGMDATEQKLFFAPFTKSRNSQGLGLGLALVKRLVAEVGGQISLRSVKGQGTRFKVSFPVNFSERDSVLQGELEVDDIDPRTQATNSSPMALLPHSDILDLNLMQLRKIVKLGQLSEIEIWLKRAYALPGLSPESLRLLSRIREAVDVVDLDEVQSLLDQVDTPLSFI